MKGSQIDPYPSKKTTLEKPRLIRINTKVLLCSIFKELDDKAHKYSANPFPTDLDQTMLELFPLTYFVQFSSKSISKISQHFGWSSL